MPNINVLSLNFAEDISRVKHFVKDRRRTGRMEFLMQSAEDNNYESPKVDVGPGFIYPQGYKA